MGPHITFRKRIISGKGTNANSLVHVVYKTAAPAELQGLERRDFEKSITSMRAGWDRIKLM
jgi:hypothetical protein